MNLLSSFFRTEKKKQSVVLIDIGTSSVVGAYARYAENEPPILLYTCRIPIETRTYEDGGRAMFGALKILGHMLIHEGAPILVRAVGDGAVDTVLVSVDAPWQTTSVRMEHFEQEEPFTFSKSMVAAALKKTRTASDNGRLLVDESVIGTILNGYETHNPYGKKANRASVVILTSLIDENIAENIHSILRVLYHTKNVFSIAGSSLRYQALRTAFPHERDALVLDATEPLTSVSLVRRNLLVNVTEIPGNTNNAASWSKNISRELASLAKQFPLPRTIFLLAREPKDASLHKALDAANLSSFWLSDNPPRIVVVAGTHIASLVRQAAGVSPDLSILLMALYLQRRISEGEM